MDKSNKCFQPNCNFKTNEFYLCDICNKQYCINCMYLYCFLCNEYCCCFWCGYASNYDNEKIGILLNV
jgi:hypothetical protein